MHQNPPDPNLERLDPKTDREWRRLSNQVLYFRCQKKSCHTNPRLLSIADSEPQSPIAPVLRLWRADNFAADRRFPDAVRSYDQAVTASQSTRIFLPNQELVAGALTHKAQALVLSGDLSEAIATYHDLLSNQPSNKGAALRAGIIAERMGNYKMAAEYYQGIACADYSVHTDDPAQLAKRAIDRLNSSDAVFFKSLEELAGMLKVAVECKDTRQLSKLVSKTHFAIGPLGAETGFEDLELVDVFLQDFLSANVKVKSAMAGSGGKRYLTLTGFKGKCFRGNVSLMITKAPRGWQWTGIALHSPTKFWLERWKPKVLETNDPLPFNDLRAPWPRPLCFTAGGILEYSFLDSLVVAGGLFGFVFAFMMAARDCCGFGPRGFYYNELISHKGNDAFAIDFTRYKRYVPYHAETKGTSVLAAREGRVIRMEAGEESGSGDKNFVDINHPYPNDPADATRSFTTRYLHLDGPFSIKVSLGMDVLTGTLLGFMDDTGHSANNHLHFSIHDSKLGGKSVRPTPMSGQTLEDGDSNKCIKSDNIENQGTDTMIIPSHYTSANWLIVPAGIPANQAPPASVADQQWTLILSGVAVINLKGIDSNWFRETVLLRPDIRTPILYAIGTHQFPVPADKPFTPQFEVNQYVLHGTLSTIFNDEHAVNAGFSVDNWQPHPSAVDTDVFTNAQMTNLFDGIEVDVAVSDSDGFIYGLSYHITLLGKIRMGQPVVVP